MKRRAPSGPIDARLHRCARRHPHGCHSAAAPARRQPRHGPHQWLADRDRIGAGKQCLKAQPIFLVTERESVGTHGLVHVDAQRRVICPGDVCGLGKSIEVRSHHDGDERHRHAQAAATCGLFVDETPVSGTALSVLLRRTRIIEREFDVVEAGYLHVVQRRDRIAVRGDGELDRLAAQIVDQRPKLRMHAILAGAEVD